MPEASTQEELEAAANTGVVSIFEDEQPKDPTPAAGAEATPEQVTDPTPTAPEVPSKFKGKTLEEVVGMYGNLERAFGQRSNEVGELRKLTDQFLQQTATTQGTSVPENKIDRDDLLDDPDKVIGDLVANHPAIKKLSETAATTARMSARAQFEEKHGPVAEAGGDQDFLDWINANGNRLARFQQAASTEDYGIADELLTSFSELKAARGTAVSDQLDTDRKAVTAPKAGSGGTSPTPSGKPVTGKPKYRRAELMRLRTEDPRRYAKMQPEILAAYAEKRVI